MEGFGLENRDIKSDITIEEKEERGNVF